jgi:hypothetical protein
MKPSANASGSRGRIVINIGSGFAQKVLNPTNGSWWIVQVLSREDLKYPPLPWVGITLSSGG